mgnify:CR=1 FL=1
MNKKMVFLFLAGCGIMIILIILSNIFIPKNEKQISPPVPKAEIMTEAKERGYQAVEEQKYHEKASSSQKEPPLPAGEPLLY